MAGLSQRVAWLEARVSPRAPGWHRESDRRDVTDRASAWFGGWHVLRETMAPRHVEHLEAAVLPVCWSFVCRRQGEVVLPSFGVPFEIIDADPLVRAVNVAIGAARPGAYIAWTGPYALPEALADAYQTRGYVSSNDECESCGFGTPAGWFERCPLCGGAMGGLGYYRAHDAFAPTFSIPAELIDAYRRELAPHVDRLLDESDAINRREQRVYGT
jgi:hypothetical protein